jgi:hypothetical protein
VFLMCLLFRGKIPFEEKEDKEVLQHLRVLCKQTPTDTPAMRIEDRLPNGVKTLLCSCISLSVPARPTFSKLVLETLPHCWKQLLKQATTPAPTPQAFVAPGAQVQKLNGGPEQAGYTVLTEGSGNSEESRL